MMNLHAKAVCLCAGAVSLGCTSWSPAYRVSVVYGAAKPEKLVADKGRGILDAQLTSCRVSKHQDTTLSLLLSNKLSSLEKIWLNLIVGPDVGNGLRIGRWRVEALHLGPERSGVGSSQGFNKLFSRVQ